MIPTVYYCYHVPVFTITISPTITATNHDSTRLPLPRPTYHYHQYHLSPLPLPSQHHLHFTTFSSVLVSIINSSLPFHFAFLWIFLSSVQWLAFLPSCPLSLFLRFLSPFWFLPSFLTPYLPSFFHSFSFLHPFLLVSFSFFFFFLPFNSSPPYTLPSFFLPFNLSLLP